MSPSFSVCCLTYGRPEFLAEAVQSFLQQDYPGPKEMVIVNTLRHQHIVCDAPNVRVFNIPRAPTLGECRNVAVDLCRNEIIVICDDDDIILPWHLSNYAEQTTFCCGKMWASMAHQFYAEGENICAIVAGTCNVFAYRKPAWQSVQKFPAMNCGEDRAFADKMRKRFPGQPNLMGVPSYIYRWANGLWHISGQGDEQVGGPTGLDQIERWTVDRIMSGQTPTGKIKIEPKMKVDWTAKAKEFLEKHAAKSA